MKRIMLFVCIVLMLCMPMTAHAHQGETHHDNSGTTVTAIVNETNKIPLQLQAGGGGTFAPGAWDSFSYIIKSKPEGAKAEAYTVSTSDFSDFGKFVMGFRCDKPGTVEVEVVIRLKDIVKYYKCTQTIQVVSAKAEQKTVIVAPNNHNLICNGQISTLDAAPIIEHGRTLVPLRALAQAFGATVNYDATTKEITACADTHTLILHTDDSCYTLDGETCNLDVPATVKNGTTYVPLRIFAEAWGIDIQLSHDEHGKLNHIILCK